MALSAAACAFLNSSAPSYKARPVIAPTTPSGASLAQMVCTSFRLFRPPLAMIGVLIACASLKVASMFTPVIMPSRPMSV